MKKIVCEMCGSNELIKKDGVFECQTCGTKYSVEEAKKMMVEGTVQVGGTVQIDNKDKIDNYLKMAESAYESQNLKEAEDYANKIIEIEPKHASAWFIKGKAAGWQSTTSNIRFSESIECWSNALENVDIEHKDEMKKEVEEETIKLAKALMSIRGDNFASNPSKRNCKELCDFNSIINPFILLLKKAGFLVSLSEFLQFMATTLNEAAVGGFKTANEYYGTKREDQNRFKYTNWLQYADNCILVLENASIKAQKEETLDLIYKNLEFIQNKIIDSKSYRFVATGYGSYYDVDTCLNDTAKTLRRKEIANYTSEKEKQLHKIKEEQKKEKEKYFKEHPKEKKELEEKIKNLNEDKNLLERDIAEIEDKLKNIEIEISNNVKSLTSIIKTNNNKLEKLKEEKSNLGMLKLKEKKTIQKQIDDINYEIQVTGEKCFKDREKLRKEKSEEIDKLKDKIEKNKQEVKKKNQFLEKANIKLYGYYSNAENDKDIEKEQKYYKCDLCGARFKEDLQKCPECESNFD